MDDGGPNIRASTYCSQGAHVPEAGVGSGAGTGTQHSGWRIVGIPGVLSAALPSAHPTFLIDV